MADLINAPKWQNPYDPQIARLREQLAALENAPPPGPMYSPAEQAQRATNLQHLQLAGQVGMLSGDAAVSGIAKPMLARAIEAQKPKYAEHGVFDETSGAFRYFPGYQENLRRQQLQKNLDTTITQGTNAEMNWQRDRARADDNMEMRRLIAGLRQGQGGGSQGSLSYMGVDPTTGQPIMLHNRLGPVIQDANGQFAGYRGTVGPKISDVTAGQRTTLAKSDSAIEALDATVNGITAVLDKDPSAGQYSTGMLPGVLADTGPLGQKAVQKMRPKEVQDLISMLAYVSDGIRKELFGATLTSLEKASALRWMPSDYDSVQDLQIKAANLRALLEKDRENHLQRMQRPGMPPPAGGLPAAGGQPAPVAPTARPATPGVVEYDRNGNRVR